MSEWWRQGQPQRRHLRLKTELITHHPTDQGWRHTGRQGEAAIAEPVGRAVQQQFRIGEGGVRRDSAVAPAAEILHFSSPVAASSSNRSGRWAGSVHRTQVLCQLGSGPTEPAISRMLAGCQHRTKAERSRSRPVHATASRALGGEGSLRRGKSNTTAHAAPAHKSAACRSTNANAISCTNSSRSGAMDSRNGRSSRRC